MQEHRLVAFSEDGLKAIQDRIETLRVDLGASGAILLDQTGALLVESGHHADLDTKLFLALLGDAMAAMNAVVHLLKDEGAFDLHFHEGQNYDMHTARIDDRIFLTLVFERHVGSSRIGMIWLSLRRTVLQLRTLIKNALIQPRTAASDQIKSAVSDAFDETSSRMDQDLFPTTSTLPSAPALPTPPKPRLKRTYDFSTSPREETLREETPRDEPPAPPQVSREVLDDSKHVLTYEEARALGLINLDDSENK